MSGLKKETLSILYTLIKEKNVQSIMRSNRFYFDYYDSWNFARICIGWTQFNRPSVAIKLYDNIIEALKNIKDSENITVTFNHGNIEFNETESLKEYDLISIKSTQSYIDFHRPHLEYIDELISELKEQKEFETFGHLMQTFSSMYRVHYERDNMEYKGKDLSMAFAYSHHGKKDIAISCIDNVQCIFEKYGNFEFVRNEKKSEFNGYWCLFILKK